MIRGSEPRTGGRLVPHDGEGAGVRQAQRDDVRAGDDDDDNDYDNVENDDDINDDNNDYDDIVMMILMIMFEQKMMCQH